MKNPQPSGFKENESNIIERSAIFKKGDKETKAFMGPRRQETPCAAAFAPKRVPQAIQARRRPEPVLSFVGQSTLVSLNVFFV